MINFKKLTSLAKQPSPKTPIGCLLIVVLLVIAALWLASELIVPSS